MLKFGMPHLFHAGRLRASRRSANGWLCALFLAGAPVPAAGQAAEALSEPAPVQVEAKSFAFDSADPERRRFGKLTWLGGLRLSAASRHFGGYSGLALDPAGARLLAVSDAGTWLSLELEVDAAGRLAGVKSARLGPVPGRDGKPLKGKRHADAEALALLKPGSANGSYLIAFERLHRIAEYRFRDGKLTGPHRLLKLPPAMRKLPSNEGIEGLAVISAGPRQGAIVAFAERKLDDRGNLQGWLLHKDQAHPLSLKQINGFAITDLAALPDGGLLVLERKFVSIFDGVHMRLRRIAAKDIAPGALLDGEILLEASSRYQIDNMEGVAVHRSRGGGVIITIISDDNFSPLQRTLLMRFQLTDEKN